MQKVLNAEQMRQVDSYMIDTLRIPGILLMENAARGLCDVIMEQAGPCVAHVFCGTGNNGGDGLAAARILLMNGYDVYVIVAGRKERMTSDAAANFAMFEKLPKRVKCCSHIDDVENWDIPGPDIVIDALFGTGLARNVEGLHWDLIERINEYDEAIIFSVDIPSGVNADTGAVMGDAVVADVTVTFQYPKIGHYIYPGRDCAGELEIVRIGVDDGCGVPANSSVCAYESGDSDIVLDHRAANSNKGDYGRLLLIAGSLGMAGAAVLSARAASRVGAGLVTVGAVEDVVRVVQQAVPEATCKVLPDENGVLDRRSVFEVGRIIKDKTALAVGPGIGTGQDIQMLIENLLTDHKITKVVDADGINALAGKIMILNHRVGDVILTPHPREFANLTGQDIQDVLADPVGRAAAFAKQYNVTVVLKGATTVVASGDGNVALVCAGTPGMAKGGSGDVLTGVIAGLAAQGMGAYESALTGAYLAAMAGEVAAEEMGEYSMTPMDEVNCLGYAIKDVLYGSEEDCGFGGHGHEEHEHGHAHVGYAPRAAVQPEVQAAAAPSAPQPKREAPPAPKPAMPAADETMVSRPVMPEVQRNALEVTQQHKTAEQALAEIEAMEQTQELRKVIQNPKPDDDGPNGNGPTRRRIG